MEKFSDYEYKKIDIEEFKKNFNKLLVEFRESNSFDEQDKLMEKINQMRNNIETMMVIVSIRNSIDTTDKFYEEQQEKMDEISPIYDGLVNNYYKVIVNSKFRLELEEKWGKHLFDLIDLQLKTFDESIVEDLKEENKLNTKYRKLRASAKIMFEGKERNLSQMIPFTESKDRKIRIEAQRAVTNFFIEKEEEFDLVYDQMVKIRHKIAKKLGYEDFIQLGYDRLNRSDYNYKMVKNYREQVYREIVPLATILRHKQKDRLGYDSLMYYDEALKFLSGNPIPKGNSDWIIQRGKEMYSELSSETNEFINYMIERELLDLEAKKGKAGGGYCTYINNKKAPFIFSNFNGTSGDVDVLTHEAGHAFQVYMSRNYDLPEYIWPTLEACEIHSMSMEFLTWPWMEKFFNEDTTKYKFAHLTEALLFIPYGVTVDEFQHWVYKNPNVNPEERKLKWREIEKKYLPTRNYGDNTFLEKGGYWFRQGHIFTNPFYYIDYTLAQICAFEFFNKSNISREEAWMDYLKLCKLGGSKSFLNLVNSANLSNPFDDGTIKKVVDPISTWLNENGYTEK